MPRGHPRLSSGRGGPGPHLLIGHTLGGREPCPHPSPANTSRTSARSYGDRPLAELSAAAATLPTTEQRTPVWPRYLGGEASSTALLGARSRIEETLHEIAAFETDDVDVIGLLLHLVAILDGPVRPVDPAEPPCPLTADLIRQRVSDSLTANWPRMAYADHVADITDSVANVVLPITTS